MATKECRKCNDIFSNARDRYLIETEGMCTYCYKNKDKKKPHVSKSDIDAYVEEE